MNAYPTCPGCDGTYSPMGERGVCLTCQTLVSEPSTVLTNTNGDGNSPARVEPSTRVESLEPPPLGEVLDELAGFVRRFVVVSAAQSAAVALWIAHTHTFAAAEQTPYLAISSAEKRSGKTRLLEVLELLVARPWLTGRVTAAVLARKVDAERPTLLLDEGDAAFNGEKEYAEALRGLLNTGHRRGGKSTVCVGQGAELSYKDFSTYCAKAIAGIGKLPDTVADRSLPIRLQRRAPDEWAERFRRRDVEQEVAPLRAALQQLDNIPTIVALEVARPDLPTELDDRAQDAAEPLLAIADRAGGDWPARARRALVELHGGREVEDESSGVRLLADIRTVVGDRDRLATAELLEGLHGLDEAPWGDWDGKPLSARKLGEKLRPYGVHSRTVRFDDESTAKGFLRDQFEGPWSRYIPGSPGSKGHKVTTRAGSGIEPDSETSQEPFCDGLKIAANPHGKRDVTDVTDSEAPDALEAEFERVKVKFPDIRSDR